MLTALLGTTAAALFGSADFLGGFASKRSPALVVSAMMYAVGVVLMGALVLVVRPEAVTLGDAGWSVASGLFGTVGVLSLYAALAIGRMGVVADSKKLRPLVIGKDDCMVAAASEVCGLNMVIPSRDHERDVYPGERETVMVDNGLEIERWPQ